MSIRIMSNIWTLSTHSGAELLLLLAVGDYANEDGSAWPTIATLAFKTRCSERTVIRLIKKCEKSGELEVVRSSNKVNKYRVTICHPDNLSLSQMSPHSDKAVSVSRDKAVSPESSLLIKEPSTLFDNPPQSSSAQKMEEARWKEVVDSLYEAYPRRKARGAAEKIIRFTLKRIIAGEEHDGKVVLFDDAVAWLRARVECYAIERKNEPEKFTPYPATWFRQQQYRDVSIAKLAKKAPVTSISAADEVRRQLKETHDGK